MTNRAVTHGLVPYIAGSTAERIAKPVIVRRGHGIGYADETPHDRDAQGVLWVRAALLPPARRGQPRLGDVHPLRQRLCMRQFLCQVCRRSLDPEGPHLFLMASDRRPVREGETTSSPPVCRPCARISIQACPQLRHGYQAVWVDYAPAWGVAGILYDPATLMPLPGDGLDLVAYRSSQMPWVAAARLMASLHGIRPALDALSG